MADLETPFDSIREQIVEAFKVRLETMAPNPAVSNPYGFKFNSVIRDDFDSNVHGEYLASVIDSEERHTPDTYPVVRCEVDVNVELYVYNNANDKPTRKMNKVFSEIQRRIMEDQTFGGLAIDTVFIRNETEPKGRFNKYIEGSMFLVIKYRHNIEDPRQRV